MHHPQVYLPHLVGIIVQQRHHAIPEGCLDLKLLAHLPPHPLQVTPPHPARRAPRPASFICPPIPMDPLLTSRCSPLFLPPDVMEDLSPVHQQHVGDDLLECRVRLRPGSGCEEIVSPAPAAPADSGPPQNSARAHMPQLFDGLAAHHQDHFFFHRRQVSRAAENVSSRS